MIDLQFFLIFGGGLSAAYFGLKLNYGPFGAKEKLRLWAGFMLGLAVALGLGGAINIYRISHSARLSVAGTIQRARIERGNHGPTGTLINLLTTRGRPLTLRSGYWGPHFRAGETVAVTYLASDNSVLELKSLSAPDAGWIDEEGDGLTSSRVCAFSGAGFALAGLILLLVRSRYSARAEE